MTSAIMAFLHHVAAFTLTAAIIYGHTTFHKGLSLADAHGMQRMDIIYGVFAARMRRGNDVEVLDERS